MLHSRSPLIHFVAAFFAIATTLFGAHAFADPPPPVCQLQGSVTGSILTRWQLTGGSAGPLGCPITIAQPTPTGGGTFQPFQHGQIVTSPRQGTNMTVAVYQHDADLFLEWGDTAPFNYDHFVVSWDLNGIHVGQRDVYNNFHSRGVWMVPRPVTGSFRFIVEGCNPGPAHSVCTESWTVPAEFTFVTPPPPPPFNPDCNFPVTGPINDRWNALGGELGALGCPVENQHPIAGTKATAQTFKRGQIVLDPDRGPNLTVAAYQVESDIAVEWGPTTPFHYDAFNVLWRKDGVAAPQVEVDPYRDAKGNLIYGNNDHGIYSFQGAGPGKYTIQIEGCDKGSTGSTCTQSWSVPVTVNLVFPTTYVMNCPNAPTVTGLIGERWSKMGPTLGCPVTPEQPVPNSSGRVQLFQFGEVVSSPAQGPNMVVALYQQTVADVTALMIDVGDTFPFRYDKFIVRVNGAQTDVTQTGGGKFRSFQQQVVDGTGKPIYLQPPPARPQTFNVMVEGCDVSGGNSTCTQKWTVPVTFTNVAPLPDEPALNLDFSSLTPATTPAGAQTQLAQRGLTVARYVACRKTLRDVFADEEAFMEGAIAKLNLVSNRSNFCQEPELWRPRPLRDEVNSALRFQQIKSDSGSSASRWIVLVNACQRTGEYDTALTGYVTLLHRFGALLDRDVRSHIANDLLNKRGPLDMKDFSYCSGVPETENHLNQIESARYLTNQFLYTASGDELYDNEANGMNQYLLGRLQSFLQHDFIEYNSKPYQTYSDNALQNLFDFAHDRRVKLAARMVLDYIAAKYAVSSSSLRRIAPYRRRPSHYSHDLVDATTDAQNARFTFLSGLFQVMGELNPPFKLSTGYTEDQNMLSVSSYRAPDSVLDLLMNPAHRNFFQRFHHDGVELYFSRPDYLLTAGGYWTGTAYTFLGAGDPDDDGPAVVTTLMPRDHFTTTDDLIRINGFGGEGVITESNDVDAKTARGRIQTCLLPDFACGVNVFVPPRYLKRTCFQQRDASCKASPNGGPWTFVDFATPGCRDIGKGGFLVAAFQSPTSDGGNVGFLELHPPDGLLSFQRFVSGVCARNGARKFVASGTNTYTMTSGKTIRFTIAGPGNNKYTWPIVDAGDATLNALGTDISKWPLAAGDILNSNGNSGLVVFTNPGTHQRLTLDFSDAGEPKRSEQ